jgi:hypothetical protein
MDKKYLSQLLARYMKGEASAEEIRFVETYYKLFESTPGLLDTLSEEEKSLLQKNIKADLFKTLSLNENTDQAVIIPLYKRYKKLIAAAGIIIILIGSFLIYTTRLKYKQNELALNNPGSTISVLAALDTTHLQNRVISLPDGSSVVLSAGSRLHYSSDFNTAKNREVFLEGEAFFDVQHNPAKPFIVHTGKLETRVLGTAFNIRAVKGEKNITVTVKRGKVRVSDEQKIIGDITPAQQIIYDEENVTAQQQAVADESYMKWKDSELFIDNLTLSEAAKILEDKYHVTIIVNDKDINTARFTATFQAGEDLEKALNSICVFNEVNYRYIKNDEIEIYK